MEEKMLRITKYNIIQRIQKKLLIRRLNKHKNFDDWRKSSLKDDPEVMAIAWELASNEQYKEFPVGKQIEMFDGYNPEIISYLSLEAQIKIFEFNKGSTEFFSDDALQIVIKNNPNNFRYLTDRNKDQLIKQEDFIKGIMPNLPHSDQETIVSKKPHFILSCSKEIRERILRFKGLSSPEWQAVLTQEKKLSLSKLIKYMSYSQVEYESNQKVIANFCNSTEGKEELKKYLNEKGIDKKNDQLFTEIHFKKLFDKDTEMDLFDELVDMHHRRGTLSRARFFRPQCMHKKLLNRENGLFLHSKYKDVLDGISNESYEYSIADRVFDLLFRENTIIEKVDPKKVINYIKLLNEYEKAKKTNQIYITDKSPTTQKIYRRRLHKQFTEIIEDAFGEKAAKIVEDRPGIGLQDIGNTEVFSTNIVENFRAGFVHDLLSYNIIGLEDFIKLAQKTEEIRAFKLYYDIMSKKLGENVVTMQMCISNYPKFQDILREASATSLSEKQITQIENLCSWPTNICNISRLEELDSLEDRLISEIMRERSVQDIQKINQNLSGNIIEGVDEEASEYISGYNIMRQNIKSEETIFDYKNLSTEEYKTLTKEEKSTFSFLQQQESIDIHSIETLKEAYRKGVPLSTIFINQYVARIKIKKDGMEKFNGEITNREKIEQAAEQGKDGVKIIDIDGVELIDLGSMQANFMCHNPKMNNSHVSLDATQEESYMLYDGPKGVSTISSYYGSTVDGLTKYVYWDFNDNEIMAIAVVLDKNGNCMHDADTSHGKKLVVSSGYANREIKNFLKPEEFGEVAFYRRKRNHSKEEGMYAGKFAPDAILGIDEDKIIASQIRFGKPIPIIVNRGFLSNPECVKEYQEMIQKAKEKIQQMQEEEKRLENELER